jgi:hypothetical protein
VAMQKICYVTNQYDFFFNRLRLLKVSAVSHVMRGIGSTGAVSEWLFCEFDNAFRESI